MNPERIANYVFLGGFLLVLGWVARYAWKEYRLHKKSQASLAEWDEITKELAAATASGDQVRIEKVQQRWLTKARMAANGEVIYSRTYDE